MPCFHPKTVWRNPRYLSRKSGKPRIFFPKKSVSFKTFLFGPRPYPPEAYFPSIAKLPDTEVLQIPCGKMCIGCQEVYSRAWAVRCVHEASRHDENCFITLTYNDEFCPDGLVKRDFQLFMKRLRRFIAGARQGPEGRVSYYMAGEYGSLNFRPHFHACLFGYDFPDRVLFSVRNDVSLYTSRILSSLWSDPKTGKSLGFCSVGDVTFESAAYIARYVGKKVRGSKADKHYKGRQPEYVNMSLRPAIGKDWFHAYKDSVFPDDFVLVKGGMKAKPPRYYDKLFELTDPRMSSIIKSDRKYRAGLSPDNTPERLRAREVVKLAQLKQLKRSLE